MKKKFTIQLMDKLAGELSEKEASEFESEVSQDEHMAEEYEFFTETWQHMESFQVPAPNESLSEGFYTKLDQSIQREENALPNRLKGLSQAIFANSHLVRNLSLGLFLLAVGFILGGQLNKKTITVNQTMVQPNSDAIASNSFAAYTPSTSRIQRVNQIPQAVQDDDDAITELKNVLLNETNTNVKLAALRQIGQHYPNSKGLKQFLATQIEREHSPLVQVELLNLMIDNNQSKETIQTMESMLRRRHLNPVVQEKIKKDLPVLRASYIN